MPGLEIFSSPQIEDLLPLLCERLRQPLPQPLADEWLIVPAQGLRLWLIDRLARELGICAGISFKQPVKAVFELLAATGDGWNESGIVAWQLLPGLQNLPPDPAFVLLRDFLESPNEGKSEGKNTGSIGNRLDLALRLAQLYQHYGLYRPQLLADWSRKLPDPEQALARWQAWLWRALPGPSLPQLLEQLPAGLGSALASGRLPARIQVFGCSWLPPLLLDLLQTVSQQIPVSLYLPSLNPKFPMADLNSGLRQALYARVGQGHQIESEVVTAPLARVSVHACAGPLRELEALRQWLLARFATGTDLLPDQVAIAAPNLQPYQALIPFVLDGLPFKILGQRPLERSALLQAFRKVLELADSRMERQQVLALLELEPVARRFDLDVAERELCRHWLDEVSIRWGWDSEQRREATTVAFAENSWQSGIERLLLGYVMGQSELFAGIAPYADLEGSQGQTLGKLLSLLEALRETRDQLRHRRGLVQWSGVLANVLERFLYPLHLGDWEHLTDLFARLRDAGSFFTEAVPIGAVRTWLQAQLRELESEPLPGGQIACAPLELLQQVPSRVLCLLGLNDRGFPRSERAGELDLLAQDPLPGDLQPRGLDRELWLAALQSAREELWISYQGINARDGAELPPSLLVTELLENWPEWDGERTITRHPLHPPLPLNPDPAPGDFCPEALPAEPPLVLALTDLQAFWRNPAGYFLRQRLELGFGRAAEPEEDCEAMELQALERHTLGQQLLQRSQPLEAEYASMLARSQLPVGRLGRIRFEEGANQAEAFAARKQAFETENEPQVLPFAIACDGLQLEGELSLWPNGQKFSRYGALRPQELMDAWISHLLLQQLDVAPEQRFTHLLGVDKQLRFEPVALAEHHLEQVLKYTQAGLTEPLAYFPRCARVYAEALLAGKPPEAALRAAEAEWQGRPGQSGESSRPDWQICFRDQDPLGPRFQELVQAVWTPLLEALQEE
ncbi:MAG TPA: exodeoxyribonuclease V subunit gamma [Candidatus Obscuribacterales bacterium]